MAPPHRVVIVGGGFAGLQAALSWRGSRLRSRLLDAVREGESRTLVLLGEPGVGKTALLKHLKERASGCRVARAVREVRVARRPRRRIGRHTGPGGQSRC